MSQLVSIIIPIYNKKCYMKTLFENLQNQTLTNYECILVDDGSSDGSGELCDWMVNEDDRFVVIHIKNGGVSNARNKGLDIIKGEYVTFIDADDSFYPDYLKNLYDCIVSNDVDMVISGHEKIWERTTRREIVVCPIKGRFGPSEIISQFGKIQKDTGLFGYCWAKMIRRTLIESVRFDEKINLAEDFDFYLNIYKKVESIYFDDKHDYRYLQFAQNSSMIMQDELIDYQGQLILNLRYREFLKEMDGYFGENKMIVDSLINNYIFFSLFHSNMNNLGKRYEELKTIIRTNDVLLKGDKGLKKWILFLMRMNQYKMLKLTLKTYRNLRNIKRKVQTKG